MANINSGIYRHFRNGGVFSITDVEAVSTDTLLGIEENSLGFTPGMREAYMDRENGGIKDDFRRGDEQPTRLQLRCKLTAGALATAGVLGVWLDQQKASDDGLIRKYTIVGKWPTLPDGATGVSVTFANCVVEPGSIDVSGGQEYDVFTVRFISPDGIPTFGTY